MRRLGLIAILAALAGCNNPVKRCTSDSECGVGTCAAEGFCVLPDDAGAGGGGTGGGVGGGAGGGVGGGGGAAACDGGCDLAHYCSNELCLSRFESITFSKPTASTVVKGDAGVDVVASLNFAAAAPTASTDFPAFLPLSLQGAAAGQLASIGNGSYTATVPAGSASGTFTLTASYPDAGLSAMASFAVDAVPPQLTTSVQAAPTSDGWHRDEAPFVLVSGDEPLAAGGTVQVESGALLPSIPLAGCVDAGLVGGGACDGGTCLCFRTDFSVPTLNALSGTFRITASATDLVGNSASAGAAPVSVTRQRWVVGLDAGPGFPRATPAVDSKGNLYVGTGAGLVGISSAGALLPNAQLVGPIEASPAIGTSPDGGEFVFYGSLAAGSGLNANALPLTTGPGIAAACGKGTGTAVTASIAVTSLTATGGQSVAAVGVLNDPLDSRVATIFINAQASTCLSFSTANSPDISTTYPSNLVAHASVVFVPTSLGAVHGFSYSPLSGWDAGVVGFPVSVGAGVGFNGLAWVDAGSKLVGGAGNGQLFQISTVNGSGTTDWSVTTPGGAPGSPTVWSSSEFIFGAGTTPRRGSSNDAGSSAVEPDGGVALTAGVVSNSPLLGQNNLVYFVSKAGELSVFSRTLTRLWSVSTAIGFGIVTASPTLDCNRLHPGTTGILYIASQNGNLYALIVDSPKLATDADWPKYQHDAQNTGNPAMPLNAGCP